MLDNHKSIAGVDEVGRGAWAGPLVAAAVVLDPGFKLRLKDSKQLNFRQRSFLAIQIKKASYWAVGISSQHEIDRLGLQKANILAAQRAVGNLAIRPSELRVDFISGFKHIISNKVIIRGDAQEISIMAASIIAKDHRDAMMIELAKHYKNYSFDIHKGYGTSLHQQELARYGPSVLHRTSCAPVRKYLNQF